MIRYLLVFISFITISFGYTLKEIVKYAKDHSNIIKESKADIELSKLKRESNRLDQYGSINLIGDYTHYNIERTLAPLTPATMSSGAPITTTKDLFSMGVSYSVALFTGFAKTTQLQIDKIASKMSEVKTKLTTDQLIYNIKNIYLSILAQKEFLEAQQRYTNALEKLSDQIALEVKLGKKAKIDLLKAKTSVVSSKTKEEFFKNGIRTLKATLSSLVGKDIDTIEPIEIKVAKPSFKADDFYSDIDKFTKVKIEDLSIKKADKAIKKSKSSKYPQVNFTGYYGKNFGKDIRTDDLDSETLWQFGLSLRYNLYDFGKKDKIIEQAKVAKLKAKLKKDQAILDLKKEIKQAISKIQESYMEFGGNLSQLNLAKESEKIEGIRYKNGLSTINDLLLAKANTQFAKAKLIESKYNYKKSIYYLEYLTKKEDK